MKLEEYQTISWRGRPERKVEWDKAAEVVQNDRFQSTEIRREEDHPDRRVASVVTEVMCHVNNWVQETVNAMIEVSQLLRVIVSDHAHSVQTDSD